LQTAVHDADVDEAIRLIEEYVAENGVEHLLRDVLGPMLDSIGKLAQKNEVSLAQSYVAAKVAEGAMAMAERAEPGKISQGVKGPVVLGNIEDDCHALGRKIVASLLRADGWKVIDLGIDVEAEEFVDKAVEVGARVIGVSALTVTTAEGIRRVREEIDRRGLTKTVKLAAGGAAIRRRPELVEQIGADGTAYDASEAPALFERLWNEANLEETPDE
jgi:methylmalonyl-CoA mutase cobalamin-binding domain/chain